MTRWPTRGHGPTSAEHRAHFPHIEDVISDEFPAPIRPAKPSLVTGSRVGLPKFFEDPRKELPFSGVFSWKDGRLRLLTHELKGPNGIVFSPDEKFLYVSNWDPKAKTVTRYPVKGDGTIDRGAIFIDLTQQIPGEEALDGMKADVKGNLYLSAPGGVWIFDPQGRHLGTISAPRSVHNFAWGGRDGRTLYLCARSALYRIELLQPGIRP